MKRDMELIRKILIAIEEDPNEPMGWIDLEIEGYEDQVVSYHIELLYRAGMVGARDLSSMSGYEWKVTKLTWSGHEFLDSIKNESVWSKLKEKLGSDVSSLPITVVSQVAIEAAKVWALNKLGLDTK